MKLHPYLRKRIDAGRVADDSNMIEIELHVVRANFVEVQRLKVLYIEAPLWLIWFYEEYGHYGTAYIIQQSKMNDHQNLTHYD